MNFSSFFALRTILTFASTAFAIFIVMLSLNIITVKEAVTILNLPPEAAAAFEHVVSRIQEVTGNIMKIISQLANKLLGWAGVDVDLNKIKVDVNQVPSDQIGDGKVGGGATHPNLTPSSGLDNSQR